MELETPVSPGEETQNPAPVTDETPEVVTPETAEPEQADAEQPKEEADERDKALKRMERRIQRLTAARYDAEARAKQAAEEAARYREQFQQPEAEQKQDVDPVKLADVIATVRDTTRRANEIAAKGSERFPDFQEAVKTVNEEAGALFTSHGLPTALGEAILDSEDPAALLHHLGKNPDVAAELHGLSPIQQAKRIARIEQSMANPAPKVSTAPKAIKPVAAKAAPSGLADELSINEWARRFYEARRTGKW